MQSSANFSRMLSFRRLEALVMNIWVDNKPSNNWKPTTAMSKYF